VFSPLHQSANGFRASISFKLGFVLPDLGFVESDDRGGELCTLNHLDQGGDVGEVVRHQRLRVAAQQLKPVMTLDAVLARLAGAAHANSGADLLRLDLVKVALSAFHLKAQHHKTHRPASVLGLLYRATGA
jgi:hypothetical protein